MDGMWMTMSEVRTRLELEPNVSVMKMCKEQDYVRTLSCAVLRKR